MKKSLKLLYILSLLNITSLFSVTIKTLSKPIKLYVLDIERKAGKLNVGDLYKAVFKNSAFERFDFLKKAKDINILDSASTDKFIINDQNFEFYNKTKKPVRIALQVVNTAVKNTAKDIKTTDGQNYEDVPAGKQSTKFREINTLLTSDEQLILYIFNEPRDISKTRAKALISALPIGSIDNADYVYKLVNLSSPKSTVIFTESVLPAQRSNESPLLTIYVTWDGVKELRPQTGQLKGLAERTETGLGLFNNIEQKNIVPIKGLALKPN